MHSKSSKLSSADISAIVNAWLKRFETALATRDLRATTDLFQADSHWRDVVAFTWNIESRTGNNVIGSKLFSVAAAIKPRNLRIAPNRTPPRIVSRTGVETIEALFAFETAHGNASGVIRLVPVETGWAAWMLSTVLDDLSKVPGSRKSLRPVLTDEPRAFGGDNWLDRRHKTQTYTDHEPTCVVIGAGQAGLAIAARLGALGIDTLVIDRHTRIGDNWRRRYHALTLHNEVFVNHFPYLPFPETWPVYIPKDKLANWFEFYAEVMELNVWTGTALEHGHYNEHTEQWELSLKRHDSSIRRVRPRHVVFATGVSAIPAWPALPGLEDFMGTVLHSGDFTSGAAWAGKNALIVGTGTSAHDVAQELEASGAHVTMIQRSTTYVVSLKQAQKVYSIYQEGPSVDDCDLLATATSYPVMVRAYQMSTAEMKAEDQPLLDRLTARGFRLSEGDPDHTGFQMQYMRHGGGYYFNVGCSERIADGKINLMRWSDIERFSPIGVTTKNGTVKPADIIVMATGYKSQQETVRALLGDEVAQTVGPIWGFDDGGELANMWKRTPQPGLWFTAGSLAQSRIYSKYLALQINAIELGLTSKTAPPVPQNGISARERDLWR
ncbi:MAG: NAD(P)/FAD-dependent oxidoreductase [Hyphomicrobiaceae bacterium]|nr:NAD(P)/FAD-dependent oxidoreductase [Hyphomicrobiaceae bacterium]